MRPRLSRSSRTKRLLRGREVEARTDGRMTGEKGLVRRMARLESAPGTRDMLALHEALVALRGSTDSPLDYHTTGKRHKRKMIDLVRPQSPS